MVDIEKLKEFLKRIEYIDLEDTFSGATNELTPDYYSRFKFCPVCGYKNTDGHYRSCELSDIIERLDEQK